MKAFPQLSLLVLLFTVSANSQSSTTVADSTIDTATSSPALTETGPLTLTETNTSTMTAAFNNTTTETSSPENTYTAMTTASFPTTTPSSSPIINPSSLSRATTPTPTENESITNTRSLNTVTSTSSKGDVSGPTASPLTTQDSGALLTTKNGFSETTPLRPVPGETSTENESITNTSLNTVTSTSSTGDVSGPTASPLITQDSSTLLTTKNGFSETTPLRPVPAETPTENESITNTRSLTTVTSTSSKGDVSGPTASPLITQDSSEMLTTKNDFSETTPLRPVPAETSKSTSSSETSRRNTATTGPSNICQRYPCGGNSACILLHDKYFCLCSQGYYYNITCMIGKIFPGEISVIGLETSDLDNENSKAYQELHNAITEFFEYALREYDYGQTVILKVSTSSSARSEVRAGDVVTVSVVNILAQSTSANEMTVSDAINEAIKNVSSNITSLTYTMTSRCDYYGCEDDGDNCDNGLGCTCQTGLERPNPQIALCVASSVTCPDTCNGDHKQCLLQDGEPECMCQPGYWNDTNGTCQECAFGYSGVNCKDQFQLILTIVGTIASVLILSMAIALIFSARSKNKRKNIEEQNLIEEDFQNLRLQQTGFSNLGADGNIFPKIRIAASEDNRPQNPYTNQREW